MQALATLVQGTTLPQMPGAASIAFELDGAVWHLNPHATTLVGEGTVAQPALTVRCSGDVLLRLLTDHNFGLRAGEVLEFTGDPAPLYAVVDALNGSPSLLQTRIAAMTPTPARSS